MFDSSPTITSFYTIAQNPDPKRNKTFATLKPKTSFCRSASNINSRLSASTLKTGWIASHSNRETSYLGTLSRFSQSIWNEVTLGFVILALYLHVFSDFVLSLVGQIENLAIMACNSADTSSSSTSSSITVMQNVNATISTIQYVNEQFLAQINGTMKSAVDDALTYISVLSDSYSNLGLSMIFSALQSAENVTQATHDWVNSTLSAAVSQTSQELVNVTNALETVEKALTSSSVLFSDVDLGSIKDFNLDEFSNISVPLSINEKLISYNQSSKFYFNSSISDATLKLQVVTGNITDQLQTLQDSLQSSLLLDQLTKSNFSNSVACLSTNYIKQSFGSLQTAISKQNTEELATILVIALVMIFPAIIYEYYHWRFLHTLSKIIETPGNCKDPLEIMELAQNMFIARIQNIVDIYYVASERSKLSGKWLLSFVFSGHHLRILFITLLCFIAFGFQMTTIKILKTCTASSLFLSVANSSQETSTQWVKQLDDAIQQFADDINSNSTFILKSTLSQINDVLSEFESSLSVEITKVLSNIDLTPVNQGILSSRLPLESVTIAGVSYASLNSSSLASFTLDTSNSSLTAASWFNNIITTVQKVTNVSLVLAVTLLSGWLFLTMAAMIYIYIKHART